MREEGNWKKIFVFFNCPLVKIFFNFIYILFSPRESVGGKGWRESSFQVVRKKSKYLSLCKLKNEASCALTKSIVGRNSLL